MNNKTVYILGAGASYNSNIPLQKDIIKTIYSINSDSFKKKSNKQDLINLEINEAEETLIDNYEIFNDNRIIIGKFI